MQKDLIIAILVMIVLIILLWPEKEQHPDKDIPTAEDKRHQAVYPNPNNQPIWTPPPQPYTNFQYSPNRGEYQTYSNMPNQFYGTPQSQPYGAPQTFSGSVGQSPLYPQQPYNVDNWQYPQYVGPRYRFRDPTKVEPQNPYPTGRYETDNGVLIRRPQTNMSPYPNDGGYNIYQNQSPVFNNEQDLQPYITPQPQGRYRAEY